MQWIKASERLPKNLDEVIVRLMISGQKVSMYARREHMSEGSKMLIVRNNQHIVTTACEWLDESTPTSTNAEKIPAEIKKQIAEAALKEEIYPAKYGSGSREGYDTRMLYEINSERSECFEKGAYFGYHLAASLSSVKEEGKEDYVTFEDLAITASEKEWPEEIMNEIKKLNRSGAALTVQVEAYLCPKCNGQGMMGKPPGVPGDVDHWTSTQTSHVCDVCNGAKVLYKSPAPADVEKMEGNWKIEYGNDTGTHDDYFIEWWTVTNGETSFKCGSEDDANKLLSTLSASKQP